MAPDSSRRTRTRLRPHLHPERPRRAPPGHTALGEALMDKCCELSTSYTDFLLAIKPEKFEALCGFGGDGTCMFSPALYERYGAAWDARLFDYVRKTHGIPPALP